MSDRGLILSIDLDALDREWAEQPALFYRYAIKRADARRLHDEAKAKLDVTEAEVDRDVRADAAANGEKVTEKIVENRVTLDARYQRARQTVIEAKHESDVFEAACEALEHRKKALESYVYLHGQNYFATPRVKGDAREVASELDRKAVFDRRGKGDRK